MLLGGLTWWPGAAGQAGGVGRKGGGAHRADQDAEDAEGGPKAGAPLRTAVQAPDALPFKRLGPPESSQ